MERRCPSAACYEIIHLIDGYDSVLNLVPPSLGRVALPKAAFRTKNLSQVGTLMTPIHFTKFALLLYSVETDMTSFAFQLSTRIELGYSVHGFIQTELLENCLTKTKRGYPKLPDRRMYL